MSETYNGWTNYETWNVALWLSNDAGLYHQTREMAQEFADGEQREAWRLGDDLQAWMEEFPEVDAIQSQASFVADLFGAAWSEVNWTEIAENLLSEVDA